MSDEVIQLLRARPGWDCAIESLRALEGSHGDVARARATGYGSIYERCRGAMILDVVASRRRRYEVVAEIMVAEWKRVNEEHTIAWLVEHPLGASQRFGLSFREMTTANEVANGLQRFMAAAELAEDQEDTACKLSADRTSCVELAPRLDRFIGSVKGIGLALFSYMRMRSGADTIKPDKRIKDRLNDLGLSLPEDDHAVMIAAKGAAREIGVPCLVLDQFALVHEIEGSSTRPSAFSRADWRTLSPLNQR